jgi:hypothetical protein
VTATGWSWEYIDDYMTMPRFQQLTRYWLKFPPQHLSLASIKSALGIKVAEPSQATGTDGGYVPPELGSSRDITNLVVASPFGDAFAIEKLKVIQIDSRKKD